MKASAFIIAAARVRRRKISKFKVSSRSHFSFSRADRLHPPQSCAAYREVLNGLTENAAVVNESADDSTDNDYEI
jgi:hypothetical protein